MTYQRIVLSSGHSKHVRGAAGNPGLDEVNEARRVVDHLADELECRGVDVTTYHDDVSKTQNENLNRIVDFHNSKTRDLDISVHFNAYQQTSKAMGVEVLYVTQQALAGKVSSAIASCGFVNRGPKKRTDLFFLNQTAMPSILIEVCFVDSSADVSLYQKAFGQICSAIADVLGGKQTDTRPEPPEEQDEIEPPDVVLVPGEIPRVYIEVQGEVMVFVDGAAVSTAPEPMPTADALFHAKGKCSWFGGPDDVTGVSASEGLAFIYEVDDAPQLFLPFQPEGSTGLARRLNPYIHYIACRWDYSVTPKPSLLEDVALVRATKTGIALKAFPADWGPNDATKRVADLSPGLMDDLGIDTDDEVEVIYPYRN